MLEIVQLDLSYEEWELKMDSSPGWDVVPNFASIILGKDKPFRGWIYEFDKGVEGFVKIMDFDTSSKSEFVDSLRKYLIRSAVCMMVVPKDTPLDSLLESYSKSGSGTVRSNSEYALSPCPIEFGDWAKIGKDEVLIMAHHDGEPVFMLTKK